MPGMMFYYTTQETFGNPANVNDCLILRIANPDFIYYLSAAKINTLPNGKTIDGRGFLRYSYSCHFLTKITHRNGGG
jgi:hypothetical protein